jgi:hypothetical protein
LKRIYTVGFIKYGIEIASGYIPLAMTTIICPLILYGSEAWVDTSVGRFTGTLLSHAMLIGLFHEFVIPQAAGTNFRRFRVPLFHTGQKPASILVEQNRGLSNFASHISSFVIPYRNWPKARRQPVKSVPLP